MLLNEVARTLGVRPYQVAYAISVGLVPEPELRIDRKRIFQAEDLERLTLHFSNCKKRKRRKP